MENEKTYTTIEIMEMCGLTRAAILKRAKVFGFTNCRYVLKKTRWGNYIKEFKFTENQVKQMGCDHLISRKAAKCDPQDNELESISVIDQLKREHPLVTDENCFKRNWWPDIIPTVLKEDEE